MADLRPHIQDEEPQWDMLQSLTQQVYFETIGYDYGIAHNVFNLYLNSVLIIDAGVPQGGWALSALPAILDQYNADVSSGKTTWGSNTDITHNAIMKDVFDKVNGDWFESDYNEHLRHARWSRYRKTQDDNIAEITHDDPNNAMDFEIKTGNSYTWVGVTPSGRGIENRGSLLNVGDGHSVRISGDFQIIVYFDVVNWSTPAKNLFHSFYLKFTKTEDLFSSDQLHLERFYQITGSGDGFGSIIGSPLSLSPINFDLTSLVADKDYVVIDPVTNLPNLGFRVTRSGSAITCEYSVDTNNPVPTWTDMTGVGAGNPYSDWGSDDLYCYIGAEVYDIATNMNVKMTHFEMVSGNTDKPKDVAWNLVPPSDYKSGALQLFDADVEDYDGVYMNNYSWWFYTIPIAPILSNVSPVNEVIDVALDTNVSFDLESTDWGINVAALNVTARRYNNTAYPLGYDEDVIRNGLARPNYIVSYVYGELNRVLKDDFKQGSEIDTYTRWGTVEDSDKWTVNEKLTFNSASEVIETSVISGSKGKISGDFDIVLDGIITSMPTVAGDNFIALLIDDGTKRVRVMRHADTDVHRWKMQKYSGSWSDQGTPVVTTDSDLTINGLRLIRVGDIVYAYYLVDTEWQNASEWILLGSWDMGSALSVDIGITCAASNVSDDLNVDIILIEVLQGSGTFSGKVSVTINPDDNFESDAVSTISIDSYEWGNGHLTGEDGQFSFWCVEEDTPHIKFWYPYDFPSSKLSINQGVDVLVPNLEQHFNMKKVESAAGAMSFRNIGFEEQRIKLNVLFTSDEEATAFRDFFDNIIKGKSRLFYYKNYVTGD